MAADPAPGNSGVTVPVETVLPVLSDDWLMTKRISTLSTLVALLALVWSASPAVATTVNGRDPGGGGTSIAMGFGGNFTKALKYSACMRAHGVPNFPDPSSSGVIQFGSSTGINPSSPQFKRAQASCRGYLPDGGKMTPAEQQKALAQALKFAQCMRTHGVLGFPDPTANGGGVGFQLKSGSGVDPTSPAFQAAQKACRHYMGGGLLPPSAK